MTSEKHIIKVDKEITPIHYTKRTEPELIVGADYYVCFGNNIAYPCTLKEIIAGRAKRIVITKYDNDQKFGEHVLFSNEIGKTPEEAVESLVKQCGTDPVRTVAASRWVVRVAQGGKPLDCLAAKAAPRAYSARRPRAVAHQSTIPPLQRSVPA